MFAKPIATSSPLTSRSSSWRRAAELATSRPSAIVSTAMATAVPNRSTHVQKSSVGNDRSGRPDGISPSTETPPGSRMYTAPPTTTSAMSAPGSFGANRFARRRIAMVETTDDDARSRRIRDARDDLAHVGEPFTGVDAHVHDLLDLRRQDLDAESCQEPDEHRLRDEAHHRAGLDEPEHDEHDSGEQRHSERQLVRDRSPDSAAIAGITATSSAAMVASGPMTSCREPEKSANAIAGMIAALTPTIAGSPAASA